MSDVATALLQLIGRAEPAADPALAAVKLARASLDALLLRLGQTIDAKVTAQLAGGLTQLAAGGETFVLKLETTLPVNTAVTLRIAPSATGQPTVTVTVQPQPPAAQPAPPALLPAPSLPLSAPATPLPAQAPAAAPLPAPPLPGSPPVASASPMPTAPQPAPVPPGAVPMLRQPALPQATAPQAAVPQLAAHVTLPPTAAPQVAPHVVAPQAVPPQVATLPTPQPIASPASASPASPLPAAMASPAPVAAPPIASPPAASAVVALPASTVPPPVTATPVAQPAPMPSAIPIVPLPPPAPVSASPAPATPQLPPIAANPAPPSTPPPAAALAPAPTVPAPVTARQSPAAAPQATSLPASPAPPARPVAPPLSPPLAQILADPVQAAARQDSVLPLLARLAALTAPTASALPRPALEAIAMLLGTRLDLNRAPPDGKAIRDAVLRAGVITEPGARTPTDAKSALLQLRSALSGFLGGEVEAVAPVTRRPPPPLRGEPVRAPSPQPAAPVSDEPRDTARQLLGHADAALSRVKLLQLASNPAYTARPTIAAPAAEFRVEVPMQLGAETGILQLLVERDGKHKRTPAERGWRMRFALNFTTTGEVGAEIALLGRSANVALWAAEPATADALEAMLPELAPALARHGLDAASIRVRRGAPQPAARAPGQLLDSAR